nr:hypothetical protein [Deinococcus aetherius]
MPRKLPACRCMDKAPQRFGKGRQGGQGRRWHGQLQDAQQQGLVRSQGRRKFWGQGALPGLSGEAFAVQG